MTAGISCLPGSSHAMLSLCNQSFDVLNIAIAEPGPEDYVTRGWWRVAPNQCATLLRDPLEAREYFVFAADVFGNEALPGVTPMCVGTREFKIESQQDCLIRGFLDARFYEVDPQGQPSWTVFVQPRP
ncbi:MAG: DUF1036 domain-containing protein [Paracoccus denitrificans]|uniref:DUF1036 domain-containing protein n=1 Tax=Paracoccus denitrificans TaxID=266 RepID=A0A533IE24_PARDE|nr:MAG: DUF1036 domain-containing protein [Paracoccus denitrificans]